MLLAPILLQFLGASLAATVCCKRFLSDSNPISATFDVQVGPLLEPSFAEIVDGLASAAPGVEDDDRAWVRRQLEEIGDGADDPILSWEKALLNASDFSHGLFLPLIIEN